MSDGRKEATDARPLFAPERLKAFTDAVVAIAMTLLILPLMESVTDPAAAALTTGEWLGENRPQLFSFILSFVLIANFWISHHRMFDRVEHVTSALLWLTVLWMFMIVCLPVTTAVLGTLQTDALQKLVYIGNLLLTSLASLATRLYLARHPHLHRASSTRLWRGLVADSTVSLLFALALVLSLTIPAIGYLPLFLLFLAGPLQSVITRVLHAPAGFTPGD